MLVNVKNNRDYLHDQILSLIGQGGANVATQEGIYMCPSFSFGNQISEKHNDYPEFDDNYEFSPFGVCDNVEQVLERYKQWLEMPDRKFCVSFTKVTKSEQSSDGGWRWHKWGEYIGTKEPQYEYLYDEGDDIQEVYCYHIYEILN